MVCIQCFSTSDAAAEAEKHPVEVCMDKDFTLNTNFSNTLGGQIRENVSYSQNPGTAGVNKVLKIN